MKVSQHNKYLIYSLIGGAILLLSFKSNKSKKIIDFAKKWVGVHTDKGNNKFSSDRMQTLMKQIGWNKNDQWCMDFVKMIYYNSYLGNKTMIDNINSLFNYSSQLTYNNVKNTPNIPFKITTNPKISDILIFQHNNDKTRGHAGIIVEIIDNKYCYTIEGNTGSNQGNGHYVAKKKRPYIIGTGIGDDLYVRGIITKK